MKLTIGFLLVGSTHVMSGLSSVPATAQTIDLPAVRINDTSCSEPGSPNIVPPCVVDGTRTVVGQNVTITATPSTTFDLASGTYQVTFEARQPDESWARSLVAPRSTA